MDLLLRFCIYHWNMGKMLNIVYVYMYVCMFCRYLVNWCEVKYNKMSKHHFKCIEYFELFCSNGLDSVLLNNSLISFSDYHTVLKKYKEWSKIDQWWTINIMNDQYFIIFNRQLMKNIPDWTRILGYPKKNKIQKEKYFISTHDSCFSIFAYRLHFRWHR